MQYCSDKDINQLVREMVRTGWRFERGRHGKLRHPSGVGFITFPKTPSDHRCLLNLRRDFVDWKQGHVVMTGARLPSLSIGLKIITLPWTNHSVIIARNCSD